MPKPHYCNSELFNIDLTGKNYIITGANSGIGFTTAKQLSKQGAHIILACRRVNAGEEAVRQIQHDIPQASVEVMALDLGDLSSVRRFVAGFQSTHEQLHGLINNAGIMNTPKTLTEDGFESQIGVNHLGHFLLSHLLLDMLKSTPLARIINVSSCLHVQAMGREARIDFEDLHFGNRKYNGWDAYAQSKLANVLHAKKLAQLVEGTDVTAVSLHPGWVRTNLAKHSMPLWFQNFILRPIKGFIGLIEPWEGSQTTLHCILDPDVVNHNGAFFSQSGGYREKSQNAGGWPMRSPNQHAHDVALVDRFWDVSLNLVGES